MPLDTAVTADVRMILICRWGLRNIRHKAEEAECGSFLRIIVSQTAEKSFPLRWTRLLDRDSEKSYYLKQIGVGSLDFHHTPKGMRWLNIGLKD